MLFIPAGREALLQCDGGIVKKGLDGDSLCVKAHKKQYGQSQHFLDLNCRWLESILQAVHCYLALNLTQTFVQYEYKLKQHFVY